MKILVANNHLDKLGGTEVFTYTFIKELKEKGHDVEFFTFKFGKTSNKIINDLGVKFMSSKVFDIVFANHITCVSYLRLLFKSSVKIIQTCHGIFPKLEQPSYYADFHVSISKEVKDHIKKKGFDSDLIYNGIDCDRFKSTSPLNDSLTKVLSLCQSKEANDVLERCCNELSVELRVLNKHKNPVWQVEKDINEVDLVVGLGRSVYDAMSCGRPVVVYDNRSYFKSYSDGYLGENNILYSLENNCSGRYYKYEFDHVKLIDEFKKYNPKEGEFLRKFAVDNLNIKNQVKKYIDINDKIEKNKKYNYNKLAKEILDEIDKADIHYLNLLLINSTNIFPDDLKEEYTRVIDGLDFKSTIELYKEQIKTRDKKLSQIRKTLSYKFFLKTEISIKRIISKIFN